MQNKPADWNAIILFSGCLLTAGLTFTSSLAMAGASIIQFMMSSPAEAAASMGTAATAFLITCLLLPAIYFSLPRVFNVKLPGMRQIYIPTWVLSVLWVGSMGAGTLISTVPSISWILQPPFTVIAICIPIWLLVRFATTGLDAGTGFRRWGIFTIGMTISPFFLFVIEMLILASFIILFFVYLAVNPGMLQEIQQLTLRMQSIQNEEAIFNLLGPYLVNPKVLFAGWFFIAVLVPLVEEALKPLGLWFISRRIITPAQGFALGALSGAAYALVESIGSSATAAKEIWIAAVIARAGADVLHVFNTALMGWALVSAWQQRKFWRLGLVYLFVIFTHGLWNSASIVTGLSSLSGYDFFQQSTWLKTLLPYAATTMLILLAGMFTGLVGMNLKLRKEDQIAKNKTTQELFESITSDDSEISKKDTDGI